MKKADKLFKMNEYQIKLAGNVKIISAIRIP